MGEHVADRDRRVLGAHLEPREVLGQGRVEVDPAPFLLLEENESREDLADGAELEGGLPAHGNAGVEVRQPELLGSEEPVPVGDRDGEPREAVRREDLLDVMAKRVHRHGGRF
jgi:hypothetical protein